MEIERKWLIKSIPLNPDSRFQTQQFYLSTDPEIRLRRIYNPLVHTITMKGKGGLVRREVEAPVSEDFYQACFIATLGKGQSIIFKDCFTYAIDGYTIEISEVDHGVFRYAEVEFDSENEAEEYVFPWPAIVIKEVTGQPGYNMKDYWENGHIIID